MIYNDKYNSYTDIELISEYKASQNKVLVGLLYKRYSHLVLGLSLKYLKNQDDAQDAVMQIFEKLLADLLKYDITYFKSWLYTYSKNHCLIIIRNQKQQQKHHQNLEYESNFMENHSEFTLNDILIKEEKLMQLEKAINELNAIQQKCIKLFYLENYSYQDISENTGYSLNEVKSYIQNGKRNLKIKIENSETPSRT